MPDPEERAFEAFFAAAEPRLRRALVGAYGSQRGREATAEALSWAWEHWDRAKELRSPVAYLFRVGQSRTRGRKSRVLFEVENATEPWVEPALAGALEGLSERQRIAVVLVHGFGWTLKEVAELNNTAVTSVQNHLERGLTKLREALEVHDHAEPR